MPIIKRIVVVCCIASLVTVESNAFASSPNKISLNKAQIEAKLKPYLPNARVAIEDGQVVSLFGERMTHANSPGKSAEQIRNISLQAFGVRSQELRPGRLRNANILTQPVMFDLVTGQYKFTLVYYTQQRSGLDVLGSELRVLVKNEVGFPSVLATSSLVPLGDFNVVLPNVPITADVLSRVATTSVPGLTAFTPPQTAIWPGSKKANALPRLAVTFVGNNQPNSRADAKKWRFVLDATTGDILSRENLIYHTDVNGSVMGLATEGSGAEQCGAEVATPMPYLSVNIGATSVFADSAGFFTIPNAGTSDVTVDSPIQGEWFDVVNQTGATAQLSMVVTPPGPANFLHNPLNDENVRAQTNGYIQANILRDLVLSVNPTYPVIANQVNFPVNVNIPSGGFCPGNAWYDGVSINFCTSSGSTPNTAWSSVIHHEYGHHLVEVAGSGQDQYGEGIGDVVGMLISDESGTGFGFFGDCNVPLREGNNTVQFPCSDPDPHVCGQLISGSVWDTRNELLATNPTTYLDILSNLAVNSILLHVGGLVTPQITIDFLTLDDDDGDIGNGTPHYNEICTGFGLHNMTCPTLTLLQFNYPNGLPQFIAPDQQTTLAVEVLPASDSPVSGTGTISFRIAGAGAFTTAPMNELSPNVYEAQLPAVSCGNKIEFFVTSDVASGGVFSDPIDGTNLPNKTVSALGLTTITAFDFENTTGWTTSGDAADGQWNAGVPVGNGSRGDPISDFDGSGQCFLTDNVAGNSDVDSGTTILTSPVFNLLTSANPQLSYARWYSNDQGSNPQANIFEVELSVDGGTNWTNLETVGPAGPDVSGGWQQVEFSLADFATLSSNVQVRFKASDLGAGAVVEAALDAFEITDTVCTNLAPPIAATGTPPLSRYLSFVPGSSTTAMNFLVTTNDPAFGNVSRWVIPPTNPTPAESAHSIFRLTNVEPLPRLWTEPMVNVAGCEITPSFSYDIQATSDGVAFSLPLSVSTVDNWGDLNFDNSADIVDIVLAINGLGALDTPTIIQLDQAPVVPDGELGISDIVLEINAATSLPYPFPSPGACP